MRERRDSKWSQLQSQRRGKEAVLESGDTDVYRKQNKITSKQKNCFRDLVLPQREPGSGAELPGATVLCQGLQPCENFQRGCFPDRDPVREGGKCAGAG